EFLRLAARCHTHTTGRSEITVAGPGEKAIDRPTKEFYCTIPPTGKSPDSPKYAPATAQQEKQVVTVAQSQPRQTLPARGVASEMANRSECLPAVTGADRRQRWRQWRPARQRPLPMPGNGWP